MSRRARRGSSLVEVLVASAVILLAVRSLFLPLEQCRRSAVQTQGRIHAMRLVSAEVERLRSLPLPEVAAASGTWSVTDSVNGGNRELLFHYVVSVTSVEAGLKAAVISVDWSEYGVTSSLTHGTRLCGPP